MQRVEVPARLRLVADAYGLDRDGDPSLFALWNRTGGSERYDRRRRWWTDHHDRFADALL